MPGSIYLIEVGGGFALQHLYPERTIRRRVTADKEIFLPDPCQIARLFFSRPALRNAFQVLRWIRSPSWCKSGFGESKRASRKVAWRKQGRCCRWSRRLTRGTGPQADQAASHIFAEAYRLAPRPWSGRKADPLELDLNC